MPDLTSLHAPSAPPAFEALYSEDQPRDHGRFAPVDGGGSSDGQQSLDLTPGMTFKVPLAPGSGTRTDTVFHGTRRMVLDSILRDGLKPSSSVSNGYLHGSPYYRDDRAQSVFVTEGLEDAKVWADEAAKAVDRGIGGGEPERLVVLELEIPSGDVDWTPDEFVNQAKRHVGDINPKYIKRYYTSDAQGPEPTPGSDESRKQQYQIDRARRLARVWTAHEVEHRAARAAARERTRRIFIVVDLGPTDEDESAAPDQRALYSPDQARDEGGKFAPEGGGGSGAGGAGATGDRVRPDMSPNRPGVDESDFIVPFTDDPHEFTNQAGRAENDIAKALGMDSSRATRIQEIRVDPHPNAIRAAPEVGRVLAEMKARGFEMPEKILVDIVNEDSPRGEAAAWMLRVSLPNEAPDDVPLDHLARAAFGGKDEDGLPDFQSGGSFAGLVVHEMGHVQAITASTGRVPSMGQQLQHYSEQHHMSYSEAHDRFRKLAGEISGYAGTNPNEFVAETFTKLYRGESVSDEVREMYTFFGGTPAGQRS